MIGRDRIRNAAMMKPNFVRGKRKNGLPDTIGKPLTPSDMVADETPKPEPPK